MNDNVVDIYLVCINQFEKENKSLGIRSGINLNSNYYLNKTIE